MSVLDLPAYSDREALTNFIEGIRVAESAAKQMAFYTERPEWLVIESQLAQTREMCIRLAQSSMTKRLVM